MVKPGDLLIAYFARILGDVARDLTLRQTVDICRRLEPNRLSRPDERCVRQDHVQELNVRTGTDETGERATIASPTCVRENLDQGIAHQHGIVGLPNVCFLARAVGIDQILSEFYIQLNVGLLERRITGPDDRHQ